MFPLIFFSLQTLLNLEGAVLVGRNFKNSCEALSAVILFLYFSYTLLEIFKNIMSKLYKIENTV